MVIMFLIFLSWLYAEEPDLDSVAPLEAIFSMEPNPDQEELRDQVLQYYLDRSVEIVMGTISGFSPHTKQLGYEGKVNMKATRWLRGKGKPGYISRLLPYCAPYTEDNPMTVSPNIIKGYDVVIFINKYGAVVDGNAIFVVVHNHLFRPKKPNVFFNPLYDRKWEDSDPHKDYLVYPLPLLEKKIKKDGTFLFLRNLFR